MSLSVLVNIGAKDNLTPKFDELIKKTGSFVSNTEKLAAKVGSLKELNVTIAKYDKLQEKFTRLDRAANTAKKDVEDLAKQVKEASGEKKMELKVQHAEAADKLKHLNSDMEKTNELLTKLKDKFREAGMSGLDFKYRQEQITAAISRENPKLIRLREIEEKIKSANDSYAKNMQMVTGIKAGADMLKSFGETVGKPVFGGGFEKALAYEKEIAKVEALAFGDIANKETRKTALKPLVNKINELSAKTMYSNTEIAHGFQEMARGGFTSKEIVKAAPGVLNIAQAGDVEISEAVRIASEVRHAFSLPVEETSKEGKVIKNNIEAIGDVIAYVANKGSADFKDMGEAFSYAGKVAKESGTDFYETGAMIGLLANVGLRGTRGGTAIKAIYSRLAKPEGRSQEILDSLHVKVRDSKSGNFRKMNDILADLATSLSKKGTKDRLADISELFGLETMPGAAELISTAFAKIDATALKSGNSLSKYAEFLKAVREESQGYSTRLAGIMNDNAAATVKSFNSSLELLVITFNQRLLPTVNKVLNESLIPLVNKIADWNEKNPKLATDVMKISAGLGGLAIVGGTLLTAVGGLAATFFTIEYAMKRAGLQAIKTSAQLGGAAAVATGAEAVAGTAAATGILAAGGKLGKVARVGGKVLKYGGAVLSVADLGYKVYKGADTGEWGEAFFGGRDVGAMENMLDYGAMGAAFGTAILPGLGTAIGGALGASVGLIGKIYTSTNDTNAEKELKQQVNEYSTQDFLGSVRLLKDIENKRKTEENSVMKNETYHQTFSPTININTNGTDTSQDIADIVNQELRVQWEAQNRRERLRTHD